MVSMFLKKLSQTTISYWIQSIYIYIYILLMNYGVYILTYKDNQPWCLN